MPVGEDFGIAVVVELHQLLTPQHDHREAVGQHQVHGGAQVRRPAVDPAQRGRRPVMPGNARGHPVVAGVQPQRRRHAGLPVGGVEAFDTAPHTARSGDARRRLRCSDKPGQLLDQRLDVIGLGTASLPPPGDRPTDRPVRRRG
ncbi:hypothetical protein G6F22_018512 [Rhizopus arrhizus]|nr:hypothetical protein G6F22_018512 [Rhizopus arrhizus]